MRGVYDGSDPAWVYISEGGADESEERWEVLLDKSGEAGRTGTSAVWVEVYISVVNGAETAEL
jgi:hypothetical protein